MVEHVSCLYGWETALLFAFWKECDIMLFTKVECMSLTRGDLKFLGP